jgi:flagellar biosynthetic protein FlhB/flagellar biosynthetic protein FliR/FlhB
MSDKTEKATAYKLQKAKEQGQVSKSTELNSCIFLFILLIVASVLWPANWLWLKELVRHLFYLTSHFPFSVDAIGQLNQLLFKQLISIWLPFALTGLLAVIIATIAQTGFVWSWKPLAVDFKRLHLVTGMKRLCSSKALFEAVKQCIKLTLVIALLGISLRNELNTVLQFISIAPTHTPPLFMRLIFKILLQLLSLLFALAVIDLIYTRWKFAKEQRMSKQDLKEEYRQREGDPKIKSKIKQLQQQLRQKTASLQLVKTADVVITNPTQLAIALKYDRLTMPAPKVICKAQGELAKEVRLLARRHQIPIIENKFFARTLFHTTELNQWIHQEHFAVAAMIFREIYTQKEVK